MASLILRLLVKSASRTKLTAPLLHHTITFPFLRRNTSPPPPFMSVPVSLYHHQKRKKLQPKSKRKDIPETCKFCKDKLPNRKKLYAHLNDHDNGRVDEFGNKVDSNSAPDGSDSNSAPDGSDSNSAPDGSDSVSESSESSYRVNKFVEDCKWLPDDSKEEYSQTVKIVVSSTLRAVICFGLVLPESVEEGLSNGLLGIEELGVEVLKSLFEFHDMAKNEVGEIIEQCKSCILLLRPEQNMPIIRLLSSLVQSYPYPMLEPVSRLKELMDYFTFMHGKVATYLVSALLPPIKFSCGLQDYTTLVVLNAMFGQQDTVRIRGTNAIIDLILAEKQSKRDGSFSFQDSWSQASCSQQVEIACSIEGGLFQELSVLLQICLYQQAKFKEVVYNGLVKLVLVDLSSGEPL